MSDSYLVGRRRLDRGKVLGSFFWSDGQRLLGGKVERFYFALEPPEIVVSFVNICPKGSRSTGVETMIQSFVS